VHANRSLYCDKHKGQVKHMGTAVRRHGGGGRRRDDAMWREEDCVGNWGSEGNIYLFTITSIDAYATAYNLKNLISF